MEFSSRSGSHLEDLSGLAGAVSSNPQEELDDQPSVASPGPVPAAAAAEAEDEEQEAAAEAAEAAAEAVEAEAEAAAEAAAAAEAVEEAADEDAAAEEDAPACRRDPPRWCPPRAARPQPRLSRGATAPGSWP
jgi:hypothetical protein